MQRWYIHIGVEFIEFLIALLECSDFPQIVSEISTYLLHRHDRTLSFGFVWFIVEAVTKWTLKLYQIGRGLVIFTKQISLVFIGWKVFYYNSLSDTDTV